MSIVQKITPSLWFDRNAEEAAEFYITVFPDSRITRTSHYSEEGFEVHGMPAGTVLTVEFELAGQGFLALNGGPHFKFSEAISLVINCENQAEIDRYWDTLSANGDPKAQQCGWLKDRFGLSWQVTPIALGEMMVDPDQKRRDRVMRAMLQMKKLDIAALKQAYAEA
jgi:predicted 3-demethylubiquinone-9 3-methyltransferase (glyoxalase superfamily)